MSPQEAINFSLELLTLAGVDESLRASFGLTAIAKLYPGYAGIAEDAKKLVSAQSPVAALPLSPTKLGEAIAEELGLSSVPSAVKINKLLEELGFQVSSFETGSKGKTKKIWKATTKGESFSQMQIDTASSGKTVFKLSWFPSVLPHLKEALIN